MLFSIYGTISVCMPSPCHSSKTVLVEIDAFDRSLVDPGRSPLASGGAVHRSVDSYGGRTSLAPHAVESLHTTSH